jgi:hypothetical protein
VCAVVCGCVFLMVVAWACVVEVCSWVCVAPLAGVGRVCGWGGVWLGPLDLSACSIGVGLVW